MSTYKCENPECSAEFKSVHPFICPKCKGDEFTSINNVGVLNNISPIFYIIALLLIVLGYITFNSEPPLEIKNVIIDDVNCSYTIITNQHSDVEILISTNKKDFILNKFTWTKDEVGNSNFFYVKKYGSENVVDYYLKTCKDALDYFNAGLDYYNKQKFDEAIIEFDKSILSDPSIKEDAYYYRGVSYYAILKYNLAIKDLNKSIANWPNYRSPYYFRGICQKRIANYELAVSNFTKYILLSEINSLDVDEEYNVYLERGECYQILGATDAAIADVNYSIDKWPRQLLAYEIRGEINYQFEEYYQASEDFTEFINGDLNSNLETYLFNALYYRGLSYFELETFLNAKYDFNRLIIENKNAEPALLSSYYRMSGICKENIFEECCSDYKTCCELGDEDCCEWLTIAPCVGANVTSDTYVSETKNIKIGQKLYGGIIFYIDESGRHGLVAAIEDLQGTYEWGCYREKIDGTNGTAIGTGYQNTMDIVNQGCATENGGITAAEAALHTEINGYNDWYLPSKDELVEMYNTIGNGSSVGDLGGFDIAAYWSSSEGSNNEYVWLVHFYEGNTDDYPKTRLLLVRVIRAF
jgi:tetratricopeptide (TPR) repeat protein